MEILLCPRRRTQKITSSVRYRSCGTDSPTQRGMPIKKTLAFIKKLRSNLFRLSSYLWRFFVPQNDKLYLYLILYITSYQYIGRDNPISIKLHQVQDLILKLKRFLLLLVLHEKRFLIRLNLSLASHWLRLLLL